MEADMVVLVHVMWHIKWDAVALSEVRRLRISYMKEGPAHNYVIMCDVDANVEEKTLEQPWFCIIVQIHETKGGKTWQINKNY